MSSSGATMVAPSPFSRSQASNSNQKRPKLSLNTACDSNVGAGKKSTSINLDTLSAVSPTARNTHKNAFDTPIVPATPLRQVAPLIIPPRERSFTPATPHTPIPLTPHTPIAVDTPQQERTGSVSSSSSTDSSPDTPRVPYSLAPTVRSILTNSPLPKPSTSYARSGGLRSSRPLFPPTKRVGFKTQLTEEIRTVKYILANSDIPCSRTPSPDAERTITSPDKHGRGSDDEDSDEGDDADDRPAQTPMAGRRKRRRWVWTLGPIDGIKPPNNEQHSEDDE